MKNFPNKLCIRALSCVEVEALHSKAALFELLQPFQCSSALGLVEVPAGFITDFASIPSFALWYVNDDSPTILFGSIIHDFRYKLGGRLPDGTTYTRAQADEELRLNMIDCGARSAQARVVWSAVRLGGGFHWKDAA